MAGLAGMFGWGLADFFAKKTIDRIGDVQTLAWAGIFGSLAYIPAFFYNNKVNGTFLELPSDGTFWILLVFFGVLQAAVYLFAYNGFGKGQIAILGPVFSTFTGIVAVISILFLGEESTPLRMLMLAVIFVGILLLSLDVGALRSRRIAFTRIAGFKEVAIATILAAIWTVLWDIFVGGRDWISFSFYMFLFMTITVFMFAHMRGLKMRVGSSGIWIWIVLVGVCETLAYLGVTLGYGVTSLTSVVTVISGGFGLPTLILASLFLKERISLVQWIGCIAIVAGLMLLPLV